MKAFIRMNANDDFVIRNVAEPKLNHDEVLIKVKCVGICGTDIPIFSGKKKMPTPFIAGHEFSGDIVEVGKNVKRWQPGQRVTAGIVIACGECRYCLDGEETMCDNIEQTGITRNGAFAEYVAVPASVVHEIPDGVTYEEGASVDPVASAYRAVKKCDFGEAETVLIIGPGPIGLYAVQIIKAIAENKNIIIVGTRDNRLEIARQLGADHIINIHKEPIEHAVKQITSNLLADITIEAAGQGEVVNQAFLITRKQGQIILAGVFHDLSKINPSLIMGKELRMEGSRCYTKQEFAESLGLISSGRVSVNQIITHRLPFDEIKKGIELINNRKAVKVCLFFDE